MLSVAVVLALAATPAAPQAQRPSLVARAKALELDTRHSGRHLFEKHAPLTLRAGPPPPRVAVSRRVGIQKASELRLRFYDPASPAVTPGPRLL